MAILFWAPRPMPTECLDVLFREAFTRRPRVWDPSESPPPSLILSARLTLSPLCFATRGFLLCTRLGFGEQTQGPMRHSGESRGRKKKYRPILIAFQFQSTGSRSEEYSTTRDEPPKRVMGFIYHISPSHPPSLEAERATSARAHNFLLENTAGLLIGRPRIPAQAQSYMDPRRTQRGGCGCRRLGAWPLVTQHLVPGAMPV